MDLESLSSDERLRLMKFVCSFAWADLHVHEKEVTFVRKMVKRLELDEREAAQVERWLKLPPRPEEVDPAQVPVAHRKLFLEATRAIIMADGEVHPEEQLSYELLDELLR